MWILQAKNAKRGWWRFWSKPLHCLHAAAGTAADAWLWCQENLNKLLINSVYYLIVFSLYLFSLQGFVVKNYKSLPELSAAFQEINLKELYQEIAPSISDWEHIIRKPNQIFTKMHFKKIHRCRKEWIQPKPHTSGVWQNILFIIKTD